MLIIVGVENQIRIASLSETRLDYDDHLKYPLFLAKTRSIQIYIHCFEYTKQQTLTKSCDKVRPASYMIPFMTSPVYTGMKHLA